MSKLLKNSTSYYDLSRFWKISEAWALSTLETSEKKTVIDWRRETINWKKETTDQKRKIIDQKREMIDWRRETTDQRKIITNEKIVAINFSFSISRCISCLFVYKSILTYKLQNWNLKKFWKCWIQIAFRQNSRINHIFWKIIACLKESFYYWFCFERIFYILIYIERIKL